MQIDAATAQANIVQLGVAPQCGFACIEESNTLSSYNQCRELGLVVATAETFWCSVDNGTTLVLSLAPTTVAERGIQLWETAST